jgi:hypothetical protein
MTERDLIAEGRARLAALEESPSTDRAFDLALWAGQNLAVLLAELEAQRQRVDELAAQRNPDDEVLVEGSWFHPNDLPKILGNYMRSADEDGRRWKDAVVENKALRARVAELEAAQRPRVDARLINVDALPVGSMVVTDAGVSALKITEFAPGVTDDDGYRSEWATPAGTVGTYDLALPAIVLREIQEVQL